MVVHPCEIFKKKRIISVKIKIIVEIFLNMVYRTLKFKFVIYEKITNTHDIFPVQSIGIIFIGIALYRH
jgi:hypothetical protein